MLFLYFVEQYAERIIFLKKIDESFNILINKKVYNDIMSSKAWKCYRCNLVFTDASHADLHVDLSKHAVREINLIKA
ncbi:hypothetical protein DYY67_0972 [Candidatus Nitrosotalea sp. TS]|nr:hypothetical protein [Candidatus Nitrosotalea sp. TS]